MLYESTPRRKVSVREFFAYSNIWTQSVDTVWRTFAAWEADEPINWCINVGEPDLVFAPRWTAQWEKVDVAYHHDT